LRPTWTCAPYQLPDRPGPGEHVAWTESNAIVFANSVLGARTDRYGNFLDICAAITGREPDAGLHCKATHRGQVLFDPGNVPERLLREDVLYLVLGRNRKRRRHREPGNATHRYRPDNRKRAWMLLESVELPVLKLSGRTKGILIRR
jgi:predicted aconitase